MQGFISNCQRYYNFHSAGLLSPFGELRSFGEPAWSLQLLSPQRFAVNHTWRAGSISKTIHPHLQQIQQRQPGRTTPGEVGYTALLAPLKSSCDIKTLQRNSCLYAAAHSSLLLTSLSLSLIFHSCLNAFSHISSSCFEIFLSEPPAASDTLFSLKRACFLNSPETPQSPKAEAWIN